MSTSSAPGTKDPERKWLPWVIGLLVVFLLAWWMLGRGKGPETAAMDTTQAVDTSQAMTTPVPVDTATPMAPEPATMSAPPPVAKSTSPKVTAPAATPMAAPSASTPSRADTIRQAAEPPPPPAQKAPGAMGGRGAPGKKAPPTTP